MTWGVNQALERMVPDVLEDTQFRLFPSRPDIQQQADGLLLQSGCLAKAQTLKIRIKAGVYDARVDVPKASSQNGIAKLIVLKSRQPDRAWDAIGREHQTWMASFKQEQDASWEADLERRHFEILPSLIKQVQLFEGWGISYGTSPEIDQYFLEWGQVYLRRMWGQEHVGMENKIGGNQFNEFLGVLAALAGRAQKHLCFASMLKRQHPSLDIRNLLTTYAPVDEFIPLLAGHLDADALHIQRLLTSLTLCPDNKKHHLSPGDMCWAPLIRASHQSYILPMFGLEINPFLFLLRDLKNRFPKDWFRIANGREARWIADLNHLFNAGRWQRRPKQLKLRLSGKISTDCDYIVYDGVSNELGVFQLKWQDPVAGDERARMSAGKNLVDGGNEWVRRVTNWLEQNGSEELAKRAGIAPKPGLKIVLFIMARYEAYFSQAEQFDKRATWVDWNHFLRMRLRLATSSLTELAHEIRTDVEKTLDSNSVESYFVPLGDLVVLINPEKEPDAGLMT